MKTARFNIYEIEHHGDEESAIAELRRVGCTDIQVVARDHEHDESMRVECKLPDSIRSVRELETLTDLCL
jgi:uncharacterized protein YcbK (DUF882 family)